MEEAIAPAPSRLVTLLVDQTDKNSKSMAQVRLIQWYDDVFGPA